MTGRTHSLEVLVLIASAFPMQLAALPALFGMMRRPTARLQLWIVPAAVWLTVALALALTSAPVAFAGDDAVRWVGIAIAGGALAVMVELLVGSAWAWAASGTRPAGVQLADGVPGAGRPLAVSTAVTGFAEEILFRGVWLAILVTGFGWPSAAAAVLVTVVYALNHAYLGVDIVAQKLCSGGIFVALVLAGGGVLAAAVAHVTANLLIAFLPLWQARVRGATT
jgi:uncharacterized protein